MQSKIMIQTSIDDEYKRQICGGLRKDAIQEALKWYNDEAEYWRDIKCIYCLYLQVRMAGLPDKMRRCIK